MRVGPFRFPDSISTYPQLRAFVDALDDGIVGWKPRESDFIDSQTGEPLLSPVEAAQLDDLWSQAFAFAEAHDVDLGAFVSRYSSLGDLRRRTSIPRGDWRSPG